MLRFIFSALIIALWNPLNGLASDNPKSGQYWVFLGTYTGEGGSRGIYRSSLDVETGKLSEPELAMELESPSFLHISPDGRSLYAISEGNQEGGVHSFRLDSKTGKLSDQVSLTSGGVGACHISTDGKNQFALVSNYSDGSFAFFKLKPNGELESRIGYFPIPVTKIDGADREARGHCGFFDATGTLAFTCDAGQDKVHIFNVDRKQGTVTPNDPPNLAMPALSAPRHIQIAPDNKVAFVNGERDMTVNLVKLDVAGDRFKVIQSLSTLRESEKVKSGYTTAECRIHPNGKYVYVSNRGHNTIAVFNYDGTTN